MYGVLSNCFVHSCEAHYKNTNNRGGGTLYTDLYRCEIYGNKCIGAASAGAGSYEGTAWACVFSNNTCVSSTYRWSDGNRC